MEESVLFDAALKMIAGVAELMYLSTKPERFYYITIITDMISYLNESTPIDHE